jgi:repressor of nif and glnA expression
VTKPGCGFANLNIKPEHVETLKAAMQADDISGASIHEWLKKRGYHISEEMVRKHRRGVCVCP